MALINFNEQRRKALAHVTVSDNNLLEKIKALPNVEAFVSADSRQLIVDTYSTGQLGCDEIFEVLEINADDRGNRSLFMNNEYVAFSIDGD